jgi:hypothetical protein
VPDTTQINTTNSVASITAQAQTCAAQHGTYPNFVLVDFYDAANGAALQAAAQLNGVTYKPVTIGTRSPLSILEEKKYPRRSLTEWSQQGTGGDTSSSGSSNKTGSSTIAFAVTSWTMVFTVLAAALSIS